MDSTRRRQSAAVSGVEVWETGSEDVRSAIVAVFGHRGRWFRATFGLWCDPGRGPERAADEEARLRAVVLALMLVAATADDAHVILT